MLNSWKNHINSPSLPAWGLVGYGGETDRVHRGNRCASQCGKEGNTACYQGQTHVNIDENFQERQQQATVREGRTSVEEINAQQNLVSAAGGFYIPGMECGASGSSGC